MLNTAAHVHAHLLGSLIEQKVREVSLQHTWQIPGLARCDSQHLIYALSPASGAQFDLTSYRPWQAVLHLCGSHALNPHQDVAQPDSLQRKERWDNAQTSWKIINRRPLRTLRQLRRPPLGQVLLHWGPLPTASQHACVAGEISNRRHTTALTQRAGAADLANRWNPPLQTAASLTRSCKRQPLETHALNGSQRQQGAQQAPAPARW